jgi:hypothetical protein
MRTVQNRRPPGIWWPIYRISIAFQVLYFPSIVYLHIYPDLPQAIGGPSPRCAYIDLVRSEMSSSSFDDFLSSASQNDYEEQNSDIVRSVRVFVYFSGNVYILVRKAAESSEGEELKEAPLYELRRGVIRVIEWCTDKERNKETSS